MDCYGHTRFTPFREICLGVAAARFRSSPGRRDQWARQNMYSCFKLSPVHMLFPERRIILRRNSMEPIPLSTYEARRVAASAHATTRLADLRIRSSHSIQDIDSSSKADPRKEPHSLKIFGERMEKKKQRQNRCSQSVTNAANPDPSGGSSHEAHLENGYYLLPSGVHDRFLQEACTIICRFHAGEN